jgi:uncharacterized protein (TIGR03066 family)
MNLLRFAFLGCLIAGLAGCGSPTSSPPGSNPKGPSTPHVTEPSNKDRIVGIWEVSKAETMPKDATVEFTKDGKLKLNAKGPDGKALAMEGTYSVDGTKLMTTMKGPDGKDMKETATITKLTDKELAVKDEKGKTDEFKKK